VELVYRLDDVTALVGGRRPCLVSPDPKCGSWNRQGAKNAKRNGAL
jgi:hypothetical protein